MPVNLKKIICLLLLGGTVFFFVKAQSPAQVLALEKITRLELITAREILQIYSNRNPREPLTEYLFNYSEFIEVFVTGDHDLWEQYKSESSRRLKNISTFKNGEYYFFSIWNIHLQTALLRFKFGDNVRAGLSVYKFYNTLQQAISLQPNNYLNFQGKALFEIFFSLLPEDYLWAFRLAGFNGDFDKGISFLDYYSVKVSKIPGFANEARLIKLLVTLQLEDDPEKVVRSLEERNDFRSLDNASRYIYSWALIKSGQSEKAIDILTKYKPDSLEQEISFMYLLLGEVLLYKGEKDANKHIEYFLLQYKGSDYRKVAWQKLSMYYLLENNKPGVEYSLKNLYSDGSLMTDPDRQAFNERDYISDYQPALLRSRLRFDGGYYKESLSELAAFTPKTKRQELEYLYRMGRVNHKIGNLLNANVYYHKTIDEDNGSGYYFAAYSALMLAGMYAEKNENQKAADYYKMALRLNQGDYKRSIDFQIRKGLRKLNLP